MLDDYYIWSAKNIKKPRHDREVVIPDIMTIASKIDAEQRTKFKAKASNHLFPGGAGGKHDPL